MKRWITLVKVLFGTLVTCGGVYIFLRDVDVSQLTKGIRSIRGTTLLVCCILAITTLYFRSVRWNALLPKIHGASKKNLFGTVVIGFMLNNIFPARIGEAVRTLMVWRFNGYSLAMSFGSLLVERIIDTSIFLIFFIVPVFVLPPCAIYKIYGYFALLIVFGFIFCALVYRYLPKFTKTFGNIGLRIFPRKIRNTIKQAGRDAMATISWLHNLRQVGLIIGCSLVTSFCYVIQMMLIAHDMGVDLGVLSGMFTQAFAAFGAAIPLSPGYVGTLHAALLQGISAFGVKPDTGRAIAIIYHAVNYIPVTLLGIYYFFRSKISLQGILKDSGKIRIQDHEEAA